MVQEGSLTYSNLLDAHATIDDAFLIEPESYISASTTTAAAATKGFEKLLSQNPEMEQSKSNNSSRKEEINEHLGTPIHSQVRKIKQEYEKIKDSSSPQPEMRPVLAEITRQLSRSRSRSRSPLGLAGRPISVGD
ncbi:hypothetical protein HHK36_024476 [Tetracentron sinense]|uniref:Uncharacterized protein n=1 Tax=Tetracentron sinense TaxID=13715 RepID=A0A835D4N8_TETSI|nr:hypothetical protein HHK36_024476 [Tetracentron sinense]